MYKLNDYKYQVQKILNIYSSINYHKSLQIRLLFYLLMRMPIINIFLNLLVRDI